MIQVEDKKEIWVNKGKIDEVFVYLIKRRKDIIRRRVEKLE